MKTCCSHGHHRGPHPPLKPGWKPRLIFPSLSSATDRFTCHESLTVTSKTNPTMIPNIFSSYAVVYMYTYWYVLRIKYLYILYILYVYTCKVYTAYSIETSATQTCACFFFFFFFLGLHESELFRKSASAAPSSAPTWRVRSATSEDALCFRDESEPQPAGSPVGDAANYGGRNLMLVAWVLSKMGNCDFLILTWFSSSSETFVEWKKKVGVSCIATNLQTHLSNQLIRLSQLLLKPLWVDWESHQSHLKKKRTP